MDEAPAAIERVRGLAGVELRGLHLHIGSQLLTLEPFRAAVAAIAIESVARAATETPPEHPDA